MTKSQTPTSDKEPQKVFLLEIPEVDPNPERTQRSNFKRQVITMPPKMVEALQILSINRSRVNKPTDMSSLIREAVGILLDKERAIALKTRKE